MESNLSRLRKIIMVNGNTLVISISNNNYVLSNSFNIKGEHEIEVVNTEKNYIGKINIPNDQYYSSGIYFKSDNLKSAILELESIFNDSNRKFNDFMEGVKING